VTTLLDALGTYLPTKTATLPQAQKLVLGVNLFLARLPAEAPDACVVVQQYEGQNPTFTMGPVVSELEHPRIQISVRGTREDYPGAYDLSIAIRNILGAITSTTSLSGISVLRIEPLGLPNPIGYDQVERPRFTTNFQVHYKSS
jgi:hypothetical protein